MILNFENFHIFESNDWLSDLLQSKALQFDIESIRDVLLGLPEVGYKYQIIPCFMNKIFNRISKKSDILAERYYYGYEIVLSLTWATRKAKELIERHNELNNIFHRLDSEYEIEIVEYGGGCYHIFCVDKNKILEATD